MATTSRLDYSLVHQFVHDFNSAQKAIIREPLWSRSHPMIDGLTARVCQVESFDPRSTFQRLVFCALRAVQSAHLCAIWDKSGDQKDAYVKDYLLYVGELRSFVRSLDACEGLSERIKNNVIKLSPKAMGQSK